MNGPASVANVRMIELLLGAVLVVIPNRLHWSKRSSCVLTLAAVALVGAGAPLGRPRGPVARVVHSLSRNREIIVGATLFGVQYLLTEEESAVRGVIAGLGAALAAAGLALRLIPPEWFWPGGSR